MIIDYSQIQKLTQNNLELQISQAWVSASESRIRSMSSNFIPEVSLYAKTEKENLNKMGKQNSSGLYLSLNLFNGFKDVAQNKLYGMDYEIKKLSKQKAYNDLVFLAKVDYWQALKTQDYIRVLDEYQSLNEFNKSLISKKVKSGLIPKSEELNSKKVEFNISEEMVKAKDELSILKSDIRKIFTIQKDESVEFQGKIEPEKMQLEISNNKIDLALVKVEEERGHTENRLSSFWRMPKISVYADQSFSELRDGEILDKNDNLPRVFGVKLILPLLSEKNDDSIEEQAKKRELEALNLKRKAQLIERENEDEKRLLTINYLKNSIDRSKNKVDLSKEILTRITSEFKTGIKEADSLNDSTEKYIEAKKDLLSHQVDYILAIEQAQLNNLN